MELGEMIILIASSEMGLDEVGRHPLNTGKGYTIFIFHEVASQHWSRFKNIIHNMPGIERDYPKQYIGPF